MCPKTWKWISALYHLVKPLGSNETENCSSLSGYTAIPNKGNIQEEGQSGEDV
jgi:hypothetical protein